MTLITMGAGLSMVCAGFVCYKTVKNIIAQNNHLKVWRNFDHNLYCKLIAVGQIASKRW